MKASHLLLLALIVMSFIVAVAAQAEELASTVWITEPEDWVYSPLGHGISPQRSGFVSILFFHSDGTLTLLEATVMEGLHPDYPFFAISQGGGFLLYTGTWIQASADSGIAEYKCLALDKAVDLRQGQTVRQSIEINHGVLKLSESLFVAPDRIFAITADDFSNTYLRYVCKILGYHDKEVPECQERSQHEADAGR